MSTHALDALPVRRVRPAGDGRPPCHSWPRPATAVPAQPPLALDLGAEPAQPCGAVVTAHAVRQSWAALPADHLPDAKAWSISLAQAMVEALQGRRPIPQLTRWVDERVLAAITVHRRTRAGTADPARVSSPAVLRSLRLQFPQPEAAEVSAHLMIGQRSIAIAFRLEAHFDRWLCTALELGPTNRGPLNR